MEYIANFYILDVLYVELFVKKSVIAYYNRCSVHRILHDQSVALYELPILYEFVQFDLIFGGMKVSMKVHLWT